MVVRSVGRAGAHTRRRYEPGCGGPAPPGTCVGRPGSRTRGEARRCVGVRPVLATEDRGVQVLRRGCPGHPTPTRRSSGCLTLPRWVRGLAIVEGTLEFCHTWAKAAQPAGAIRTSARRTALLCPSSRPRGLLCRAGGPGWRRQGPGTVIAMMRGATRSGRSASWPRWMRSFGASAVRRRDGWPRALKWAGQGACKQGTSAASDHAPVLESSSRCSHGKDRGVRGLGLA
jgi:hypothetical protein